MNAPLVASSSDINKRRKLTIFILLLMSLAMSSLDHQIVSTALPSIVAQLGGMDRYAWIGASYLLASSAVMPIYGKLGDLYGRKNVVLSAVGIFTIGSITCAFAGSFNALVAARVVQGLGGGGIMVSVLAVTADLFAARDRPKYQSYTSLVIVACGSLGPTLGGNMSEIFGWRSVFLINLPLAGVTLAGLIILLPTTRSVRTPKIDYAGAVLLAGITVTSSLALQAGEFMHVLGLLALSGTFVLSWIVVERRAPEPILRLSLFKNPTFSGMLVVTACSGAVGIGITNYHALFLQRVVGMPPATAGLFFIASTGGIVVGSMGAGRLISTTGYYKPFCVIGLLLNTAVLFVFSRLTGDTSPSALVVMMGLQGLAVGLGQQVPVIGVQNAVTKDALGAATGFITQARMAGASVAISLYGSIVAASLGSPESGSAVVLSQPIYLAAASIAAIGFVAALFVPSVEIGERTRS